MQASSAIFDGGVPWWNLLNLPAEALEYRVEFQLAYGTFWTAELFRGFGIIGFRCSAKFESGLVGFGKLLEVGEEFRCLTYAKNQ